jgi:ABC-type polysaccharide/polyol phosphate transport system ATPase subunit
VGTGFHPELTGRENIYLNGAILGMTKAEIDRKFDEACPEQQGRIADFSGVEKFIDTPVKRYSSGMLVRLAFAVAVMRDTFRIVSIVSCAYTFGEEILWRIHGSSSGYSNSDSRC